MRTMRNYLVDCSNDKKYIYLCYTNYPVRPHDENHEHVYDTCFDNDFGIVVLQKKEKFMDMQQ